VGKLRQERDDLAARLSAVEARGQQAICVDAEANLWVWGTPEGIAEVEDMKADRARLSALTAAANAAVAWLMSHDDPDGLDGFDVRLCAANLRTAIDAAAVQPPDSPKLAPDYMTPEREAVADRIGTRVNLPPDSTPPPTDPQEQQ
jgi:hypothetical protein